MKKEITIESQDNQSIRTVKTLLLSKINHDNYSFDSYRSMYKELRDKRDSEECECGTKYLSLGSVDAFSLYNTSPIEKLSENNWFGELYKDRREITLQSSEKICYHPIHLIANQYYEKSDSKEPFCLVTLIYGITEGGKANVKPQEGSGLSNYEVKIQALLDSMQLGTTGKIEIYNAVNLCDAVIVWHTDDIIATLNDADFITECHFARKTFTLIGLQWSDEHQFITEDAIAKLCEKDSQDAYSLRIQGSIRDRDTFDIMVQEIVKEKTIENQRIPPIDNSNLYLVPGQSDFTIVIPSLTGNQLFGLLRFYFFGTQSADDSSIDVISPACWDIHTDLMYNSTLQSSPPTGDVNPEGNAALGDIVPFPINYPYETITSLYFQYNENIFQYLYKDPWVVAFHELLSVHASLDRHPVLSGTAYLIRSFLEITYYYLSASLHGPKKVLTEKATEVIASSLDTIQEGIHVWGALTEQMLRIDDFIFRGIGSSSVLFNTLPECALDFYHAYLHEFVDLLLDMDCLDQRVTNKLDYQYDFLLLPELDKEISILPIFNADATWRPNNSNIRQLGPPRQAFIVYFPIETVFSPIQFFAPLLHECFHYFGDACRLREKRSEHVCSFLANLIVMNLSGNWAVPPSDLSLKFPPITNLIYDKLHTIFLPRNNILGPSIEVEKEPTEHETKWYLSLENVQKALCCEETAVQICDNLSAQIACDFGFDFFSSEGLRLRKSIREMLLEQFRLIHHGRTQYLDLGIWLEAGIQKVYSADGLRLLAFSTKIDDKELSRKHKLSKTRRNIIIGRLDIPDVFADWKSVLVKCWSYFKECYADLMMLSILKLDPETYLSLFLDELEYEIDWISTAQRIALVLATAYPPEKVQRNNSIVYQINEEVNLALEITDHTTKRQEQCYIFVHNLINYLLQADVEAVFAQGYDMLPPASINEVFLYLQEVKQHLETLSLRFPEESAEKLSNLQEVFTSVFQDGGFLSKDFFKIIEGYHKKVQSQIQKSSIIRELQTLISQLIVSCPDASTRTDLFCISKRLLYSDPKSIPQTEPFEKNIIDLVTEIEKAINANQFSEAKKFCQSTLNLIDTRNQIFNSSMHSK